MSLTGANITIDNDKIFDRQDSLVNDLVELTKVNINIKVEIKRKAQEINGTNRTLVNSWKEKSNRDLKGTRIMK